MAITTHLQSDWTGLNKNLLASFCEVDSKGIVQGSVAVSAPLSQAQMEASLQWQSAFENSGAESKLPALTALLQSGALQPAMAALQIDGSDGKAGIANEFNDMLGKAQAALTGMEGRTGITKLNSTQVFVGMEPVKFTIAAQFRAWMNPTAEVERPISQLMEWALPQHLSPDGAVTRAINWLKGRHGVMDTLMPSVAPTMIAMRYKNRTYAPLVIESISDPIDAPIDGNGNRVQSTVNMTLASLAAWDRDDWHSINTRTYSIN